MSTRHKQKLYSHEHGALTQQLGMLLGYAVHLAGGTLKLPPLADIQLFLVNNFAVDKSTDENNNIILTLVPQASTNEKVN